LKLRKYQEALDDARTAKRLAPNWPKAPFREGQAFRGLGDLAEAAASFWEAHRLDPGSEDAREQFNKCVFDAKQAQAMQQARLASRADEQEAHLKDWAASHS
jgi:tetratricopeptide (TPR) repeat protein